MEDFRREGKPDAIQLIMLSFLVLLLGRYVVQSFQSFLAGEKTEKAFETNDSKADYIRFHRERLYCPYCGKAVEGDYVYCNLCGRRLP